MEHFHFLNILTIQVESGRVRKQNHYKNHEGMIVEVVRFDAQVVQFERFDVGQFAAFQ